MNPHRSAERGSDTQDLESAISVDADVDVKNSKLGKLTSNKIDDEKDGPGDSNSTSQSKDQNEIGSSSHPQMSSLQFYVAMGSITLAVLLIALNNTALGTAIPAITAEFNTVDDIGWYSSASLIANCVMVPLVGKIYRGFRIKLVFITFIIIFELGSLIAALSTSSMMLIIARAISGIGGSGIINGSSTIVAATVPIAKRSFINGIILGCFAVGQAAGPLIGGALTEGLSWRWCFYINLPLGGLVVLLFVFVVRLPVTRLSEKKTTLVERVLDLDFVGFVIFAAASVLLLVGLQWGGTKYPWNSPNVIGLMCGGLVAFGVVGFWFAYKGESALLPPRLLRSRVSIMITITSFLQSGGSVSSLFWLPIWFQAIRGVNALQSGVMLLPLVLSQLFASVVCGALVQKTGYYLPEVVGGNALVAIGAGLTATFSLATSDGEIIGYQVLMGAGRGFVLQLLVLAMQANVPREDASIASAYAMFSQLLGGAIFSALAKTIFTSSIGPALHKFAPDIDPSLLINTGATEITKVIPKSQVKGALLAYNEAINNIFYLQLAAASCAFLTGWGMGWKNLKHLKQEKEPVEKDGD
ncbi:MFS general substrate transporter [Daldinia caldariorum]|uniref:MFS general substrate transporter n=1 Tax=Daldinia caldariorum TaxID=326644 RepID=UPI0020082389|nr:MFS general substrate transporter [Daldinia caldariorum]KAI1464425.1 MFS general substrate transporter [Daldinia caldariorum]